MRDVYQLYAKHHAEFTADEIYILSKELDTVIYFDALSEVSVRVSQRFICLKKTDNFDVDSVDKVIESFMSKDYIRIREIDSFLAFPSVGYEWNEYMLESFLISYSKKFALLKRKYFYCCKSEKTGITYRTEHKSVHEDVAGHPAIMGHEFAGDIVKVGKNHQDQFKPGMKFTLQPALNHKGTMWSPGGKKLIYTHLSMPPTLS